MDFLWIKFCLKGKLGGKILSDNNNLMNVERKFTPESSENCGYNEVKFTVFPLVIKIE